MPGSTGPRAPAARTCSRKKASARVDRSGVLPAVRRNAGIPSRFRAIAHPRSDNTANAAPRNPNAMIRKGADTTPNKTRYDIRRLNRLLSVKRQHERQSSMPVIATREFKAPIEPAAFGEPVRSQRMRLRPRSSPSRQRSSYSGSRAARRQHRTRGALPKRVLPLNRAAHPDARSGAVLCIGHRARAGGCER